MNQMNQTQFSEYLGVKRENYNRWEHQLVQPDLLSAWKIAKKLGVTIEDLFEEREG